MHALEVAVYALLLAGGGDPFTCARGDYGVACSNGLSATRNEAGHIVFDNGVEVVRLPDGRLAFSNGISAHWGSAGWVQFSHGVSVRRMSDGSFRFSNDMVCRVSGEGMAACEKTE